MNSCHGMEEFDMEPKRIKPGYLRQVDIDNGPDPAHQSNMTWREACQYIGIPRIFYVIAWGVVFAAGAYLVYLAWQLPELYRALVGR